MLKSPLTSVLKMFNVLSVQYWITKKLYYKIAKLGVFKEKKRAFVLRFFFHSFFSFCLCKTKHAINVSIVAKFRHEEALRGMKITPLAKVQHYQGSFFVHRKAKGHPWMKLVSEKSIFGRNKEIAGRMSYCKVLRSNMSRLEAHAGFFR